MSDKIIKVKAVVYLTVNVSEWNREYLSEDTPTQIRDTIKYDVESAVRDYYRHFPSMVSVDFERVVR